MWHLHIPPLLLGVYNVGVGGQEGVCEGLVCNPRSFPDVEVLSLGLLGFPSCLPFPRRSSAQAHLSSSDLPSLTLTLTLWLPRNRPSSSGAATSRP